jgi:lipopolysaccharide assembly protein A
MMRIVAWLVRALLFLLLFAFALNNRQPVAVYGFFGMQWQAPLVIVVLLAFAIGAVLGVLAMVPSWWRARRALAPGTPSAQDSQAPAPTSVLPTFRDPAAELPPRLGL